MLQFPTATKVIVCTVFETVNGKTDQLGTTNPNKHGAAISR